MLDEEGALLVVVRNNVLRSFDGGASWRRVGEGLDSDRRITSLAFVDAEYALVATDGAGIYRWSRTSESFDRFSPGPPERSFHLAASTGDPRRPSFAAGSRALYRLASSDGRWEPSLPGRRIDAIGFGCSGAVCSVVVADSSGRLFVSQDAGVSWTASGSIGASTPIQAIQPSGRFAHDGIVFAAPREAGLLRVRLDAAMRVEDVQSLRLPIGGADIQALVAPRSASGRSGDTLLAVEAARGVLVSRDGGRTWLRAADGLTRDAQAARLDEADFDAIVVQPRPEAAPRLLVAGFDGLFASVDGGESWTGIDTLSTATLIALAVSPDFASDRTVAVNTYLDGVLLSHDGGRSWTRRTEGLEQLRIGPGIGRTYDLAFARDAGGRRVAFNSQEGRVARLVDEDVGGDGVWERAALSADPLRLGRILGALWYRVRVRWPTRWRRSVERVLPERYFPAALAVSPGYSRDRTLIVGARGGAVFRSVDGGRSFERIARLERSIRDLEISPEFATDHTVFATTTRGGAFRSRDAGVHWSPIHDALPAGRGDRILLVVSPAFGRDRTAFAATDEGLLVSRDGGDGWERLEARGLPAARPFDALALSPAFDRDGTVIVSVRGRGLHRSRDRGRSFVVLPRSQGTIGVDGANLHEFPPAGRPVVFSPTFDRDRTIFAYSGRRLFRSVDEGDSWELVLDSEAAPIHRLDPVVRVLRSPVFADWLLVLGAGWASYLGARLRLRGRRPCLPLASGVAGFVLSALWLSV